MLTSGDFRRADWNQDSVETIAVTASGVLSAQLPLGNFLVHLKGAGMYFKMGDNSVTTAPATGNFLPSGTTFWIESIPGQQYIYFITDPGESGSAIIMDPGSAQ